MGLVCNANPAILDTLNLQLRKYGLSHTEICPNAKYYFTVTCSKSQAE